jgi:hypothetical protein
VLENIKGGRGPSGMPSQSEQLQAIDKEISRSQNYIKYIESKLSPDDLRKAQSALASKNTK